MSLLSIVFVFLYLARVGCTLPEPPVFLDCGGTRVIPQDGITWYPDTFASANTTIEIQEGDVKIPFKTARIFDRNYTYKLPVGSGRKLIRLYFFNGSAKFNSSHAVFNVHAQSAYTLVKNFSVAQCAGVFVVKEFVVTVKGYNLNITFQPLNSYAIVNGIEVLSIPPHLYSATDGTTIVGQSTAFFIDESTSLENLYRLNVGGESILSKDDPVLFRSWHLDDPYLLGPAYGVALHANHNLTLKYQSMAGFIAPWQVYATARSMGSNRVLKILNGNLTWVFPVDSGFSYLVRLHFCELNSDININQRVFFVLLNNLSAGYELDVVGRAGGNGVPIYLDYVLLPTHEDLLWLTLQAVRSVNLGYYDVILNGVEIFKINDSTGNFGGRTSSSSPKEDDKLSGGHGKPRSVLIVGAVFSAIVLAMAAFCAILGFWRREQVPATNPSTRAQLRRGLEYKIRPG